MGKRLSFGPPRLDRGHIPKGPLKTLHELMLGKKEYIKSLSFDQLKDFPDQNVESMSLEGRQVFLTVYKEYTSDGELLIAIQGFMPTWWFPNYISYSGVGKMFSDGVLVTPQKMIDAPEKLLYKYK